MLRLTTLKIDEPEIPEKHILEINKAMLEFEKTCAETFDENFGPTYKMIAEKAPELITGVNKGKPYYSERTKSFMRWALEVTIIDEGMPEDVAKEFRNKFSEFYEECINYFHPEAYNFVKFIMPQ